ncbi:MAG: nucleoside transporter C-terminal domain-containing protein [Paludisphaera borealis]|uniref:NupC/NupG family nucleoside CNT transporter n=1 Tax=Paludisphaera borealis TaxID=1387353 RepID=UPI00285152AC|nr:nucleoside transporter C-terminal domain-containing protein [Paludisphaera borealis]MDR3618995.1 nucleoside transporter C-terminal domain-containing protein [Paludisphaera borealis]
MMRTAILALFFTLGGLLLPAFARDVQNAKAAPTEAVEPAPEAGGDPALLDPQPTIRIEPIVIHHGYRLSIGRWSIQFRVPSGLDLLDLGDRVRGLLGMVLIVGVAIYLSENRAAISWKVIFWGLALQWIFAILVLRVPAGVWLVRQAGSLVEAVFGKPHVDRDGLAGFVFAILVLPTVVYASALFAVLYHLGVMQRVVRGFAATTSRLMGTSGAESLDVAASMFLGQTEAPLAIRPYLPKLTTSELLTVTTVGMANVSGLIMAAYFAFGVEPRRILTAMLITAPGAVLLSKLLIPETETPETFGRVRTDDRRPEANILAATVRGTREGFRMGLSIAATLLAVTGLIVLINLGLDQMGTSLEAFFGWALAPVAYMLGVAWEDCRPVGGLLGTRTVLNELVAFQDLVRLRGAILDRSFLIASFALCGFANIGSLGIQLGGLGALIPERRRDLARLGIRALLAATLANFLTACIAGVLL